MIEPAIPQDDELIAAELAFGLLDGDEHREAQDRVASDPAFADAYARWCDYAAAMATGGEAPSPSLWAAIQARIPSNDTNVAVAVGAGPGGRARWFVAGALAASIACGLIGVSVQRAYELVPAGAERARTAIVLADERKRMLASVASERSRARVVLVAVLTGNDRRDSVTVSFDPANGKLISAPASLGIGDRAAQLWVIPADGTPRSLGVISASSPGLPQPRPRSADALAAGVTIAVSVEPPGGSPRDTPTGPVILTGKMTSI